MKNLADLSVKLKELDRLVIKSIVDSNIEEFANNITAFNEIKKAIKTEQLRNTIVSLPDTEDKTARLILQLINDGELLPGEKAINGTSWSELFSDELEYHELEDLVSDEFYSWFDPNDYIKKLYKIGSLIVPIGKLPKHLQSFVEEARQCYAFQLYNSVFSLCRTMMEICVKDLCFKYAILPLDTKNILAIASRNPDLNELIKSLCETNPKLLQFGRQLHDVRKKGNFIIHGNRTVTSEQAELMLKDTLKVIHAVYEISVETGE